MSCKKKRNNSDSDDDAGKTDLRQVSPQLYLTRVEEYFRRFEDIDFVQRHPNTAQLITKNEILESLNPIRVKYGRHLMIVGAPGTAKASIAQKIAETFASEYGQVGRYHSMFIVDFRQHPKDIVSSVAEFLYQTRPRMYEPDKKETMLELMRETPFKAFFVLMGLDTVPFDYMTDFEEIRDFSKAKTSVILLNLLAGKLFPHCKILSTCREYRVKEFKGALCPQGIIQVGELTDASVEWFARELIGRELYKDILRVWDIGGGMMSILNRTMSNYSQNLVSAGKNDLSEFAHSAPMCTLHMVVCCTYGQRHEATGLTQTPEMKRLRLPIFNKIKQVAYHAFMEGRVSYPEKEVEERFSITLSDIKIASVGYPHSDNKRYKLIESQYPGVLDFMNRQAQEFLCAIVVVERSINDFKVFLRDCIHVPRYHVVRRMICGLVLDPQVFKFAYREKIIQVDPKEMRPRRKLLEASMSAEFPKVKRQELLEFFRAVRDAGDGGVNILPRIIDVIDLSNIRLFGLDMHAISACISSNMKVGHVNLNNCDITPEGLELFSHKAIKYRPQIDKLTLDWNTEWNKTSQGIEAFKLIVLSCCTEELHLNHTDMTTDVLRKLNDFLLWEKVKILRAEHNPGLWNDEGFNVMGDFVNRHTVEHLYVSAGNVTPQESKQFAKEMTRFPHIQ